MRPRLHYFAILVASALGLSAQNVRPDVLNSLYPSGVSPVTNDSSAGQFSGLTTVSGSLNSGRLPGTTVDAESPLALGGVLANEQAILSRSYFGAAFAGATPRFLIGDILPYPTLTFTDDQARPVPLRRRPVETSDSSFYFISSDQDLATVAAIIDAGNAVGATPEEIAAAEAQLFQPNTISAQFFWSPHAQFRVSQNLASGEEEIELGGVSGALADGFVYASRAGVQSLRWTTTRPVGVTPVSNTPIFGLIDSDYTVGSGTAKEPRRIFWTEESFDGPVVSIPSGEIQQVNIAYTDQFPEQVADGEQYIPPGATGGQQAGTPTSAPITQNTLWFNTLTQSLNAYNREGLVLVEFLGETRDVANNLRRQVGVELVRVIREPAATRVDVPLGERLYPLDPVDRNRQVYPLSNDPTARLAAQQRVEVALETFDPQQVLTINGVSQQFTGVFEVDGDDAFFAQRVTFSPGDVQFYWLEEGVGGLRWPRFLNRYNQFWPDALSDFALNVRPTELGLVPDTLPLFGNGTAIELVYQDDRTADQARLNENAQFEVGLNADDPVNRSLLLLRSGSSFYYLRVESVLDSEVDLDRYASFFNNRTPIAQGNVLTATVGERLTPPVGADSVAAYVDLSQGDAIDPIAYIDPFVDGVEAAEAGAVIPVNASRFKGSEVNDQLSVWWFERFAPEALTGAGIEPFFFPSYLIRYQIEWPNNADRIVMASNRGTGDLAEPGVFPIGLSQGTLYVQNDPILTGYNPNEEHALLLGSTAYALRDDLNVEDQTSAPYVLIRYEAADGRPSIKPFEVLREDTTHTFEYPARAGAPLPLPQPLGLLPLPLDADEESINTEVASVDRAEDLSDIKLPIAPANYAEFTFEDRNGLTWLYRGPHDPEIMGVRPALGMQFYYPTQPGFAFPDPQSGEDLAPAIGTNVPYLRAEVDGDFVGAPTGQDNALVITYVPYWPDEFPADPTIVPNLPFAETLVDSKFNLPSLVGATSVESLYQQSIAIEDTLSALLHDPTRARSYILGSPVVSGSPLSELPNSLQTSSRNGRIYFQGLPPHLEENFYYDPNQGPTGNDGQPVGALVLKGEFIDPAAGFSYLLLNVLSSEDLDTLRNLPPAPAEQPNWASAINSLQTTLETFIENPLAPGTFIPDVTRNRLLVGNEIAEVIDEDTAVDSYAFSAIGGGSGYVTLILGNGEAENLTDPSEPVQLEILKVGDDLSRGSVIPLTASNPLAEQVTLQQTNDFAGRAQDYEYEWYYTPPVNGQPPVNNPDEAGVSWIRFGDDSQGPRVVFGGGTQPLLTVSDNYFVMRYRPKVGHVFRPEASSPADWSAFTAPALAEGWIKRVLAGINPFNQRIDDFFNNPISTDISLLTQAGTRFEGAIPLTLDSVQATGLIEIYETLLRRASGFTIDAGIDYGPANDALLLAAGFLNDLYVALGNEAFADASNPLISLDVDPSRLLQEQGLSASIGTTIQNTASSRFAFEGQVPDLLTEELVMLRGRDDFLVPGSEVPPVYNRFFWNFTRGIDAGEVIYALNYNIREQAGEDADGQIDASDAARLYPQGHGDAFGHYLTALKNYYRLLSDPDFTWTPRVEAVNILGQPVTVDYQDERKFASAAVSLGRTVSRIVDLERRKLPASTDFGWTELRESEVSSRGRTRTWGAEQWASRGGQGNYLHWMMANALLPEEDTVNEGLQKIDRETVPELDELSALGAQLQRQLDAVNTRSNALGLTDNSFLFDIAPSQLDQGATHFDQVLERAKDALAKAAAAAERTIVNSDLLRSIENQADDYSFTVDQQESAFLDELIAIYGRPYPDDIGPGRTYPQGYTGPDLINFRYITRSYIYPAEELFSAGDDGTSEAGKRTFNVPLSSDDYVNMISSFDGSTGQVRALPTGFNAVTNLDITVDLNEGPYQIAPDNFGARPFNGTIQQTLAQVLSARESLFSSLDDLEEVEEEFGKTIQRFTEDTIADNKRQDIRRLIARATLVVDRAKGAFELAKTIKDNGKQTAQELNFSVLESLPRVNGFSNDTTSAARAALLATRAAANTALSSAEVALLTGQFLLETATAINELRSMEQDEDLENEIQLRESIAELISEYEAISTTIIEVDNANVALLRAIEAYRNERDRGDSIQAERETFRKRAASVIQGSRIRDVAFRAFRTESLEQFEILFDQAARYAYLAAQAYDYETGLLGSELGREFLAKIVATRSIGLVDENGEPQFAGSSTGDAGLSSLLAQLEADWEIAQGRLGINNPDQFGSLFSLRRELFNLPFRDDGSDEDHKAWQDVLKASVVSDIRTDADVAAHALPLDNWETLSQPGIIISFASTIQNGLNFFGNPLGAGDSAFSSASFTTKIDSVGVSLNGYIGITSSSGANALSATPLVYLIPAGVDTIRTPPINGSQSRIRTFDVLDHAMPFPFDVGGVEGASFNFQTQGDPFFLPRRHQPFRAVDDPTLFYSTVPEEFTNSRLIGRSVWNGQWKLVIPASALLSDPDEGLERFIESVRDIELFMRTYSNAGN